VSPQLSLLPSEVPGFVRRTVPLEAIQGFADATPSAKLRELLGQLGQLQPIVVAASRPGRYVLIDGRRRRKAIAQLAEEGEWAAPAHLEALVFNGGEPLPREMLGGLSLALHASRSPSPASELDAIEAILNSSTAAGEAATIKEIAAQTGMSVQTVRRRLKLRWLGPALRDAFAAGKITAGVAEAAARLPEVQQQTLACRLGEGGRLTLAIVRDASRQQSAATTAELPGELLRGRALPWQAAARAHLIAALEAIPASPAHEPVARLLAGVVREIELS